MNRKQNILKNIKHLIKFEPLSLNKIYYVNSLTTFNTMAELITLVSKKKQFVIETKYDDVSKCPKLIQILFVHRFKLHIVLVEALYLPNSGSCLHYQIEALFSIILLPCNIIQSWNDIKAELRSFLNCSIISLGQIEKLHVLNIQHKFQEWFQNNFANIELNYVPSNNWTLETAIAFLFQQYFDTSVSKSRDWNIGLFAKFDTHCDEKFMHSDSRIFNLLEDNRRRSILGKYAVHECMAVNKIAALLQNDWTQKHAENYLKKYYSTF